jgi:general secretion pathway protein K
MKTGPQLPQQGIALITAILVVAIAALASTALLVSANLAIHRTTALRDTEQGWWLARGVEAWVLGILQQDGKDNAHDGLDEPWAQPVDYLPVDQGFVSGQIVDAQGRFNLNNLAAANTRVYQDQFARLLASLDSNVIPQNIVANAGDWIDDDQNPRAPAGAEDSTYLNLPVPYRAANAPFSSVSELLAVEGVTPELFSALMTQCPLVADGPPQPCVTALRGSQPTEINVNTASERILQTLSDPPPDPAALQQFLREREEAPDQDMAAFTKRNIYAGAGTTMPAISVSTRHFLLQGQVVVGSSRVALYSLILRPRPGNPVVLVHSADAE